MKLIELSHTIESGMPMFSSKAPQPIIRPWMSHNEAATSGNYQDCTCEISEVSFVTSIGTYIDSPYHFDPSGKAIDELSLDQLILPGVVVDCTKASKREALHADTLENVSIKNNAVLFHTGWSRFWGKNEYYEYPFLAADTAQALLDGGAKMVGIDTLVIDNTQDPTRPVHNILLKHGVLIVENLTNLHLLPKSGFTFHAAPLKIRKSAAFPIRAYAVSP